MKTTQYMSFEFGNLHYTQTSTNKEKTLLCLPSFHSSVNAYHHIEEAFKNEYNIICLDFPGHGASDPLNKKDYDMYGRQGFASILKAFIERLSLSDYIIIGNSIGGNCAVRAMENLNGLLGVVLLGSVQAHTTDDLFAYQHQTEALQLLFKEHRTAEEDKIVTKAYVNPCTETETAFTDMLYDLQRTDSNCRKALAHNLKTETQMDELAILQKTNIPFCIILGEEDTFINTPVYKNALIQSGIDKDVIYTIKGVGHLPQLDIDRTTLIIQSFLNNTSFALD